MPEHRESPTRRVNPGGDVRWVARATDPLTGRRVIVKPAWNRGKGTFERKRDAQRAIDEFYDLREAGPTDTVGAYFETWVERHPRSERTNATNEHRIGRVLDIEIDGVRLRDWPYRDLRRRHAHELVRALLVDQRRARNGAVNILRSVSAMTEDAITDDLTDLNFVKGVRVRATDPRVTKRGRPPRVFSFAEMHAFAARARHIRAFENSPPRDHEALVRTFTDTGMRLGEVLPLERADFAAARCPVPDCRESGPHFHIRRTAHEGTVTEGDTETKRHVRIAPCSDELARLIAARPARIDTPLLFPTPSGRLWRERNFYRDVWDPTRKASGVDIRPHDCRHSFVTHLAAAGIDEADLAAMAGQTIETMNANYRHSLGRSLARVREIIG